MKQQAILNLLLLFFAAVIAGGKSPVEDRSQPQQTQARGYWVDPSTGLTWTAKDNGKDVSWSKAKKYCRSLRLAGFSDWRLANLVELQGIFDKNANVHGLAGTGKERQFAWHVKGGLFLTGDQWSSERINDDRGRPSGYAQYFDFNEGKPNDDPAGWPYPFIGMRALCVRGTEK